MRTTIELPDPLFRLAKSLASEKGISLKVFFTEALRKEVNNPAAGGKRMETPPITLPKSIPGRTNEELQRILNSEEVEKER